MTSSAVDYLLCLLLSLHSGLATFVIEVPTNYTALEGPLTVHVVFPEEVNISSFANDSEQRFNESSVSHDEDLYSNSESSVNHARNGPNRSFDSSTQIERTFLSLNSFHLNKTLKNLEVPSDGSQTDFIFPCGVVEHAGLHIVLLKNGSKLLAESKAFNASWPKMVVNVPIRLETYRSPADVQFSFTKAHSCPPAKENSFKIWAELLYHGMETLDRSRSSKIIPTRLPASDLRLLNSKISLFTRTWKRSSEGGKDSPEKPKSKARPRRLYTLTSLQGSTIPSRSNNNLRPKGPPWNYTFPSLAQVVQRVPILGNLYSHGKYDVRFSCEVVGPAGIYSVKVVSDVLSAPVIAESDTIQVDWAEEFSMQVPLSNLIPCVVPIPVTYTHPLCVGKRDKIRLYANIKANVTSVNPPLYQRYITERRAVNQSTTFDCELFTDEPTEYCFVYVNTALSGAVSDVRTQCVATFKPGVLRVDGDWGTWSSWTNCTSHCGFGIRIRHRFCNDPPPRNGGLFCLGEALETSSCGDLSCVMTASSSGLPPISQREQCQCGCDVILQLDLEVVVNQSADECHGTSTWIFQSPSGSVIAAELTRARLLPGFQWLKIRDGNKSESPLLLSLPSFKTLTSPNTFESITSSEPLLMVQFQSDVNSSLTQNFWGFRMTVRAIAPMIKQLSWSMLELSVTTNMAAFHVTVMVLGSCVLVATAGYLALYCHLSRTSRVVLQPSPLETPTESPYHEIREVIASTASVATLTEILSLKSLKFGPRRPGSYSRLAREGEMPRSILRSLPSSPLDIRRSSTQLIRLLRRGNSRKKVQNRRSASFDHLRSDVSPIHEDKTLPNSLTLEDLSDRKDTIRVYIEAEPNWKGGDDSETGEDFSVKYKEYRKSLLESGTFLHEMKRAADWSKHIKDKTNQEKANKERLKRESKTSSREMYIRPSPSVSQLSMASGCVEMEYDYYDYDVGNASAIPGSFLGMDPNLMPWSIIDIDDLDIKTPDELVDIKKDGNCQPPEIMDLNILSTSSSLQQSSTSNESSFREGVQEDTTPRAEVQPFFQDCQTSGNSSSEQSIKILNINEVEDFQFADDSEGDDSS